ncbi:alpha-N-acetylneuraminide alpha-2,8-sialyltransferase-like [Antedon mediterranea]|uniref:alpha-N-acetylneuraminide alpha-2,8-sialyltransferase-like n=1 Tax=Antedon mediterranea TaxID=105859 RepID=UPI003AF8225F
MKPALQFFWFALVMSVMFTTCLWWNIHQQNIDNKYVQMRFNSPVIDLKKFKINFTSIKTEKKTIEDSLPTQLPIRKDKFQYIGNMSTKSESKLNISTMFMKPWKHNISNLQQLRSDFKKTVHTELILSQRNVNISQTFKFFLGRGSINISEEFYKLLLKDSPESNVGGYKRCAIVGNGGILNGSKCGKEIDEADFVIRCNAPPINGFQEDAGVKSNLTTVNPSIIQTRYGYARTHAQQSKFIEKMKEYNNYIWFPSFTTSWIYKMVVRINKALNTNVTSVNLVHGNPNHFKETRVFWSNMGIRNRISTGFYITTAALMFCDEVHLYGFWPFSTDIHNRPTSYHYYEDVKLKRVVHAFNKEFDELATLHSKGILQLHVDDCY